MFYGLSYVHGLYVLLCIFLKLVNKYKMRSRDVVKAVCHGTQYMIIGVEGQDKVHPAMPLRCLEYDVRQYIRQFRDLTVKNREEDRRQGREEIRKGSWHLRNTC